MSKPAHKEDEDVLSSGSDTETESEEDEDTVSSNFAVFPFAQERNYCFYNRV